ncbi:MAG: Molybdopterin converting factor-like protein, partial [uncultured bacterium]
MNEFPLVIAITEEKLDIDALLEKITLPSTGAAALFTGIVRGMTAREMRKTDYLEYEAYKPMA